MDPNATIPLLLQLGIAAPFVVGMWLAYRREVDRSDRLEKEVQRLNDVTQEKSLPALSAAAAALKEVVDVNSDIRMQLEIERRVSEALSKRETN